MSVVYDVKNFMGSDVRRQLLFQHPVDYLANVSDPWFYEQIASCDIHIYYATGPWENRGPTYASPKFFPARVFHSLDNWGPQADMTGLNLEDQNARIYLHSFSEF